MELVGLPVELEAHAPVPDAQSPFRRIDVRQTRHVAVTRDRETVQRGDDASPDLGVEPVGIAPGVRCPNDGEGQGRPQRRFTSSCGIPRPSSSS